MSQITMTLYVTILSNRKLLGVLGHQIDVPSQHPFRVVDIVLQADAHVAAHQDGVGGHGQLGPADAAHGPGADRG